MRIDDFAGNSIKGALPRSGKDTTAQSPDSALSLYLPNEGCALLAVNSFLQKYPSALLCGVRDKDDMLSDAYLILWRCCQSYDPSRNIPLPIYAFKSIQWRLFKRWRQNTLRVEAGKRVRIPAPLCLSEPAREGVGAPLSDCLPAESGGGRWGSDGLAAVLHAERLENARAAWKAKAPWLRAKCPGMAAELEAVFGSSR